MVLAKERLALTELVIKSEKFKSRHGQHKLNYYSLNKEKYLQAQRKYRAKLKTFIRPIKTPSQFQQKKSFQALKYLETLFYSGSYSLKIPDN
jgi:hypothetical protein